VDEAARQGSQALENAGGDQRNEEALRREIAETRQRLAETAAALAEKSDVKAHARQRVQDVKYGALHKKDELVGKAKATSPDTARSGAQRAASTVRENPMALYVGLALLLGFLLGRRGRGD
jgi:ElaB/YqjD/DUF883 family membrane-anchored ribosome-binding protein